MLSIVVPVYNGEKNLEAFTTALSAAAPMWGEDWELLFIDDGSTDDSLSLIKQLAERDSRTGWLSFTGNSGQQAAVLCGLRHCRGDLVVTMDDDLEHPPEVIPSLIRALDADVDAVYAVPEEASGAGSRQRDLFFRLALGKPQGLRLGSFRIFSRRAVDAICRAGGSFVYISAELFGSGFTAKNIRYVAPAVRGRSRYGTASRFKLYIRLFSAYGPVLRHFHRNHVRPQYEIAEKGGCL